MANELMKKGLLNLTSYQRMQIEQKEHKMVYLSDCKRRMKMLVSAVWWFIRKREHNADFETADASLYWVM